MPPKFATECLVKFPAVPTTIFDGFEEWCASKGRIDRRITIDNVVHVLYTSNTANRYDNLKRSFLHAYKQPIETFVLRLRKPGDIVNIPPEEQAGIIAAVPVAVNAQAPDLSVADLAKIILELQAKVERLTPGTTNNTINNNTNNIVINNFGNETMTHLKSPEEYRRLLGYAGMKRVLDDTYFNPAVPENHNVKSRSVKKNMVEVRRGDVWEVRPFAEVANTMIDRGFGYTYGGFVVTPENAEAPETYALLDLMRKTHHARLREGIRAALVTRKDRARAS